MKSTRRQYFCDLIEDNFFVDNPNGSDVKEELQNFLVAFESLQSQLESSHAMIATLEGALKFYAEKDNWSFSNDFHGVETWAEINWDDTSKIESAMSYGGEKARSAMSSLSEWRKTQAGDLNTQTIKPKEAE